MTAAVIDPLRHLEAERPVHQRGIAAEADFKREKIGEMPTEMFFHFFKSFTDGAKANLNIKAEGTNEHHKIEAVFKAFAKAVKMAVKRSEDAGIPSTKGTL